MQRSSKISKSIKYDENSEPIVISKITMDILLKCKNPSDCISLYLFYYYTAKWQKTNQPMATSGYVKKGLNWGDIKFQKAKKQLIKLGLIQNAKNIDPKSGKVLGWYIKVNFIWTKDSLKKLTDKNHPPGNQTSGKKTTPLENHCVVNPGGNTLSTNNINALSTGILPPQKLLNGKIKPSHFEKLYKVYPRKASKGSAEKAFLKLCSLPLSKRPHFKELLKAIKAQSKTKQWETQKYIPHFSTWCNQSRWKDEIAPMNEVWDSDTTKKNSTATGCQLDFSDVVYEDVD